MLVFGFHQGSDFMNAEMALRRTAGPICERAIAAECTANVSRQNCLAPNSN
jgi:hypothetical protein